MKKQNERLKKSMHLNVSYTRFESSRYYTIYRIVVYKGILKVGI